MAQKLMGRKRGMTQRFTESGVVVVCTVIEAEPNVVTQVKTQAKEGYNAVQTGFYKTREKLVTKPLVGHYKKAGTEPRRFSTESRMTEPSDRQVGDQITVEIFKDFTHVDVTGTSKGKGFEGLMKKNNFSGGPAAHGSGFHRHAGSTGMRSTPGRCLPGSPRPSQMGNRRSTVQGLKVVMIDEAKGLLLVEGAVPGPNNGLVMIAPAVKKYPAAA